MWHKTLWIEHSVRIELTREGLLVKFTNHYTTRGAHVRFDYGILIYIYIYIYICI